MDVVSAVVARVGLALCNPMMLRDLLTVLAENAIGVKGVLEPFEASGIVRKLAVKITLRIPLRFVGLSH
jgi:hypothetical protein